MRATILFLCLTIAIGMTVLLAGCGGNASPSPTAATPTPTTSTPTPPPSGGGTGTGGGNSTSGTVQWESAVGTGTGGPAGVSGTVSVMTNGDVNMQIKSAAVSTSYTAQFCQFPETFFFAANLAPCFDIGTLVTDASGNAQATVHFPKSGPWTGEFQFNRGGVADNTSLGTGGGDMSAQLVPQTTANQGHAAGNPTGVGTISGTQDPLKSGTLTTKGSTLTVTLNGAVPNAVYGFGECGLGGSSSCQPGTALMTTDASGNGTGSAQRSARGNSFQVGRASSTNSIGFMPGFIVP